MELLNDDHVVMVLHSEANLAEITKQAVQQLGVLGEVCVFALAKPATTLERELRSAGLKELHIIDAVSGCKGVKSCAKVISPEALTDLSLAYTDALQMNCKASLLGAMTVLFTYSQGELVVKFLATLAEKTRAHDARLIILALWDERQQPLLRESFLFMDKIVDLRRPQAI